jgi:hypothetical protein
LTPSRSWLPAAAVAAAGLVVGLGAIGVWRAHRHTAGNVKRLAITTTPALNPPFDPAVTDYTARCGKRDTKATKVIVSVRAPAGTSVSVAGRVLRSGAFTTSVGRAWNQSFPLVIEQDRAPLGVYTVRCLPTNAPGVSAVRSAPSTAGYYLLSAHGTTNGEPVADGFSLRYIDVVDTNGVPVWWYKSRSIIGDTKVLANGNLAWLPLGLSLEEHQLDGKLVAHVHIPGVIALDQHDFDRLPNGNWLLIAYPKVSGVDLRSIGGKARTCIADAELAEVTPKGRIVWTWFARQHIPFEDISPADKTGAKTSMCTHPRDVWHLNSAQAIGNHVLISLRRASSVYLINRTTGSVEWKLGGRADAQRLKMIGDPFDNFIGQHDAHMWSDGTVSVFDNGNDAQASEQRRVRVVRYRIDPDAHTATVIEQPDDPKVTDAHGSACCGSARRLPGGHWSIGYGSQGIDTEITASGARVLSLAFDQAKPPFYSYRMVPIEPDQLNAAELRAGMDAMHPVNDVRAPSVLLHAATCSVPGNDGWCRGVERAHFDAFDDVALPPALCDTRAAVAACRIVGEAKDGSHVMISSGRICDVHGRCAKQTAEAGPFKIDATKPAVTVTATTTDGSKYEAGTATTQAVTLHYSCHDATAGLATACPADVTVARPRGDTVTRTVADRAGNAATVKVQVGA